MLLFTKSWLLVRVISCPLSDESKLTVQELSKLRETIVNSLIAIYHPRINYPGFNAPLGSKEEPPSHQVTYAEAADVPINASGEVEEEAISRSDSPNARD